jgi:hypothetical protein
LKWWRSQFIEGNIAIASRKKSGACGATPIFHTRLTASVVAIPIPAAGIPPQPNDIAVFVDNYTLGKHITLALASLQPYIGLYEVMHWQSPISFLDIDQVFGRHFLHTVLEAMMRERNVPITIVAYKTADGTPFDVIISM